MIAPGQVAGVRVDAVDLEGAVARIESAVSDGTLLQIATINLDFLVRAQRSAELRQILNQSELNVADGMPVVWLSNLAGRRLPSRTAGSDLVPMALGRLAARGARVFLLGGEGAVAADAGRRLAEAYPGLVIAGHCEPPRASIDRMPNRSILRLIQQARPDVLLVALGNPKQELWISRHREALGVKVAIGVGCTLDLLAGKSRRAPGWMQRAGLEWLYRLGQEPRRLVGRYVIDTLWLGLFAVGAARQRLARRVAT
ncbi:MAG: WecB/TagA/CpsF family glycosyltransferase [Chloroflexi bacterium]|nr:MAG: WecB/TagA/CpsF family glycosyltransferase [Chloroflexota bacterium]